MTDLVDVNLLQRLLAVCFQVSSLADSRSILQKVVEAAAELTDSGSSSILVYEKAEHALRFIAAPGREIDPLMTFSVPMDRSVAGEVFRKGQSLILCQAHSDERIFRVVDRELEGTTNSLIAVPILHHNSPIGVLECLNKHNGLDYTEEDCKILEFLASPAAIAIVQQRMQQEVQDVKQQIDELDKQKDEFAALVSHELRTPLGVILGNIVLLQESCLDDQRATVELILKSALHLSEIVEQISNLDDLKHLEHPEPGRVAILPLLDEIILSCDSSALKKEITLCVDPDSIDGWISCDRDQITIVLHHLVKNALKFTGLGGSVRLRTDWISDSCQISVIDNGVGISSADQERIFNRFFQAEDHLTRRHGGLGLGLPIARELVELQGGRLWVESELGKGSKFILQLPRAEGDDHLTGGVFIT